MIHIGLFEGIGGFSLAAEWMGWRTLATCEINPFGQGILKEFWPLAYHHDDIHTFDYGTIDNELSKRFGKGWRNDDVILTGGFPCQGFSLAGNRLGTDDGRYLWPEMLRIVREIQPMAIVGENVTGILSMEDKSGVCKEFFPRMESRKTVRHCSIDEYEAVYTRQAKMLVPSICEDLEKEGYKVQPVAIPAGAVGAPHRRERIWFVAYSEGRTRHDGTDEGQRPQKVQEKRPHGAGHVAYPTDTGIENMQRKGENGVHGLETITDTDNEGLQRGQLRRTPEPEGVQRKREVEGQPHKPTPQFHKITDWSGFPTQPPVCTGYDGLPADMVRRRIREDSIGILSEEEIDQILSKAYSQWMKESIMAAGNAIVPQVAFEIFKVIEKMKFIKEPTQDH